MTPKIKIDSIHFEHTEIARFGDRMPSYVRGGETRVSGSACYALGTTLAVDSPLTPDESEELDALIGKITERIRKEVSS
jgi:hypothetical protein